MPYNEQPAYYKGADNHGFVIDWLDGMIHYER